MKTLTLLLKAFVFLVLAPLTQKQAASALIMGIGYLLFQYLAKATAIILVLALKYFP
jgi:hypothetical protein